LSKLPGPLIDSLLNRKCLFFIGSGMSTEAGLPSTEDLMEILVKKLKSEGCEPSTTELAKVAQEFCRKFSRPDLLHLIRNEIVEKLENADRKSFAILSKLIASPRDIVTTNWDPLIEEELGRTNYTPIFEPNAVARYDDNAKINLFKIHGDIDRDIIITEDDYREYREKWKPIVIKLLSLFQERVVVFVGYSTDDRDFMEAYMEVFKTLGADSLLPRYCVDPYIDELEEEKLRERGIKPIKMSAREFLEELDKQLQEQLPMYQLPSPKTVPVPLGDYNPFGIFRAEDVSSVDWINKTFVEPIDFATVASPGNVVIEGHRGSGKSIVLQYLNYPSLCERQENANYVGFYVKLQNSYVDTMKKGEMMVEEWKEFFLHYFNLILGESILTAIRTLLEKGRISFSDEREFVERVLFIFFPSMTFKKKIGNLRDLWDIFKRERNRCTRYRPPKEPRLSPHFVYDFIKLIEEYVDKFKDKYFYILVDEYDKLDDEQQKVVNLYLADRGAPLRYRVSFKVAVKLFEMRYETIDGKVLDLVDDYQWVPLDRFSKEKDFIAKLKEIGNTRLRVYNYKNESLTEILPCEGQGFEKGDYSGLENILNLSSYLVRDFLELAKDMLYYAYPWIASEKRDKIPPIPPHIQNFVINVHSNILYTTKIDEIPGKIGDMERKYVARLLIEKMGIVFQRVLRGSRSVEKRTVSSFQLKDEVKLSEIAKVALNDCRSVGALQVPYSARAPQNYARDAPHRKYEFHRLLCPRFRLSLARRWPKEISSEQFNNILESPDEATDELSVYFLQNIFINEFFESFCLADVEKFKDIYEQTCKERCYDKELFGKTGHAKIQRTLDNRFSIRMGQKSILCESEDEARYMKIFADIGLDEVSIPKNLDYLRRIIPEIEKLNKKIDDVIREKIEEYPILKKVKKRIVLEIWSRLLQND
jgi:hypothetical protein